MAHRRAVWRPGGDLHVHPLRGLTGRRLPLLSRLSGRHRPKAHTRSAAQLSYSCWPPQFRGGYARLKQARHRRAESYCHLNSAMAALKSGKFRSNVLALSVAVITAAFSPLTICTCHCTTSRFKAGGQYDCVR